MTRQIQPRQEVVDVIHSEVFADRIARSAQPRNLAPESDRLNLGDAQIIELASRAKNADHFLSLYRDADLSRYSNDHSAADLALMCMLLFWTQGDAAQALRIFRTSALAQRPKGERPDYLERTVAAALERTNTFYTPRTMHTSTHTTSNGHNHNSGAESQNTTASDESDLWIEPPEQEVFHGPAGEFAAAVESYYEGEPISLVIQFLLVFGNLAGRHLHYMVGRTIHYLNLFIGIVGQTALSAKGSGWDWVAYFFDDIDPLLKERIHGGCSSGEGIIHCCRDSRSEQQQRGRGANRHTELVEVDPGVSDKRRIIYEPELSSALRVGARPENILNDILRRAFDAAHVLETLTKNNPEKATGALLSIVGHITPRELVELLDETSMANGFANRFAYFLVRGTKEIPIPDSLNEQLLKQLASIAGRVTVALEAVQQSRRIQFDQDARELWNSVYHQLHDPGPDNLLGALLQRARVHTLRFAMAYAALDSSPLIGVEHLKSALALWRYSARSTTWLFGTKYGNPDAAKIFELLQAAPQGLTRTAISRLLSNNLSADRIANALLTLAQNKKAHSKKLPSNGPGRPSELWFAVKAD